MSVIIKRTDMGNNMRECLWRCCSPLKYEDTDSFRRRIKRRDRREWKKRVHTDW